MREINVILLGHCEPAIHGQSIQFMQLLECSKSWAGISLGSVNAVYASERGDLSGFSLRKAIRVICYAWQLCRLCIGGKVDIVILSPAFHLGPFLKDSLFVLLAKRICRARVLAWVHMDPNRLNYGSQSLWFRKFSGWVLSHVDSMVSCAPSLSKTWPSFLRFIPVKSVANGVEDQALGFVRNENLIGRCRIGYLSAMDDEKGWRDLYAVALRLCEKYPELEIYFYGGAGSSEREQSLKDLFDSNLFSKRIQWHGETWGEEKRAAFREMDVFCLPSHTEAFPLAVLEAMSFSLPVLATDVGAVKDALKRGEGGWLSIAGDEMSLERELLEALKSRSEWRRMGDYNRKAYIEKYSLEAFGRGWEKLITQEALTSNAR